MANCGVYSNTKEHAGLQALILDSAYYRIHAGILALLHFSHPTPTLKFSNLQFSFLQLFIPLEPCHLSHGSQS